MDLAIQINNLNTSYSNKPILQDLSLSIPKGDFVGIIGSNGAGKSTLLKTITGLLSKDSGEILIEGTDHETLTSKEKAQRIAVVPQSFNLDYDFTVEDIVMMGRNPYQSFRSEISKKDREIVNQSMERTNTLQFKDRLFNSLSGGEKQRVILARALAQEPSIILLDEPTSALDPYHQLETMELIKELNEEGLTVLAVLHDINLASRFCKRLVLLKDGQILDDGIPEEVIRPDSIKELYGLDVLVHNNALTQKPEIVPIQAHNPKQLASLKNIHLICGSDTGGDIIRDLFFQGHHLTAGVINEGCSDEKILDAFEIETVKQKPFTPVTIDKQRENLELINKSDLVLITNIPFGESNVMNLYDLEEINKPVLIHKNVLNSDYTGGRLQEFIEKLEKKNLLYFFDSDDEMNTLIKQMKLDNNHKEKA